MSQGLLGAEADDVTEGEAVHRADFWLSHNQVTPADSTITRDGSAIHINDKAMAALLCLASQPGRLVSRDELEKSAWGDAPAPNTGISQCIHELRKALGDDIHESRFIETVTGRGYRLVVKPGDGQSTPEADQENRKGFWSELKQRRIIRVSITYVIFVWAALQIFDVLFPILGLPDWAMTTAFLAGLLGFPLVLSLAWTLQWDDSGLHFDPPFARDMSTSYRRLYFLVILSAIGVLAVMTLLSLENIAGRGVISIYEPEPGSTTADIPENSIAVLRFTYIGDTEQDRYFSDGLSEELLNLLARLKELRVASRTSTWALPADTTIEDVRERLGVHYVLEGSVRRSENKIRVTTQLIKTSDGYHLWSETFDSLPSDILAVQDEIAQRVANSLKVLLSADSRNSISRKPTENMEAYEAYLQGMQRLRMPVNDKVLLEAEQYLSSARMLDPEFANAWAGLCKTYLGKYRLSKASSDFEQAEVACHRTLTLDDTNPGMFEALGELYYQSGQYEKAKQAFASALTLEPHSADALSGLGAVLARRGELDLAEQRLKQAIDSDPGYWQPYNALGTLYFNQGRVREAIPYFRRVTLLAPEFVIGFNNLGGAYLAVTDYAKASETFSKSLAIAPDSYAYSNTGTAWFMLRDFSQAADYYRRALEMAPEDYMIWGHLGDALSFSIGQEEKARQAYQRAAELAENLRNINPRDASLNVALARYLARLGQTDEALRMVDLLAVGEPDMYIYYDLGLTYIALENQQAALIAVRDAIEAGFVADIISSDPGYDSMHSNPEFRALVGLD